VPKELMMQDVVFENPAEINGKLFHHRRIFDDGQLMFLVNTSQKEWSEGKFIIKGRSVKELDPVTGKVLPYPGKVKDNKVEVDFDLPPVGSLLLMIDNSQPKKYAEVKGDVKILKPQTGMSVKAEQPNVLTLDYCDLKLAGKSYEDIYYFKAADKIFRHYGFDGNPWDRAVQYKSSIIDRDTFSVGTGFEVSFPFMVETLPSDTVKVVVEHPQLWSVSVNGTKVDPVPGEYWLDRKFAVYNISGIVKKGVNRITLTADKMSVYAEVEPVYVIGNFRLRSRNKGWSITSQGRMRTGSWKDQGYPFYADAVSYTKNYEVAETGGNRRYVVKLTDWNGSVAGVKVNGEDAGIIAWPPFELDVTDEVIKGDNEITVLVYGTLKNLLGPHHAGHIEGSAWPASFEEAPAHLPPGRKYDQLDYGLFQDFLFLEAKGRRKVYLKMKKAEKPEFSTEDTIRSKPFTVSLHAKTPGTEIRYTLDGSEPKKDSKLYTKPIKINRRTIVKARAYHTDFLPGDIVQRKFYIAKKKSYDTSNLKGGLRYRYYEGTWSKLPEFEFLKVEQSGVTDRLTLDKKIRSSKFAFLFTGYLKIEKEGDYNFYVVSNDGTKLFIDDVLVIDNDGSHGAVERSGKIKLTKGYHPFRLEYFDGGGSHALNVTVEGPGIKRQQIPKGMLWH
jgi:hypothetical protein